MKLEIKDSILKELNDFANERLRGDQEEACNFLLEYALKDLGYIKTHVRRRKQNNINLGRMQGIRRDFLWDIADKTCKGKVAKAIFALIEIALNHDDGIEYDISILQKAKYKKEYDLEALSRRASRKNTSLILSYSEDQYEIIERFIFFSQAHRLGNLETLSYLLGVCFTLYERIE